METYRYNTLTFGRVHVRNQLCFLLLDVCSDSAYKSLVAWSEKDWGELVGDLERNKADCLRADCRVTVPPAAEAAAADGNHDGNDAALDAARADLHCFTTRYDIAHKACVVNQHLALIRPALEQQIAAGDTGTPNVGPVEVAAVLYVSPKLSLSLCCSGQCRAAAF